MKIRTGFVTNSSSVSFTVIGLDSPIVKKYLKENPIIFTPHPRDYDNWSKKFEEQPTEIYSDLNELLDAISYAQDCEMENDYDIDEMHCYIPRPDNHEELEKWYDDEIIDIAWEDYIQENSLTDDMLADEELCFLEYDKFLESFNCCDFITDDYLKRLSYEYLEEISDFDQSDRVPQLAPLKSFIIQNLENFHKDSRCIFANMVVSQGGMSGWVDLTAYTIDKGTPAYLRQQYYSPGDWDYNPEGLTKNERWELICANLEKLESFFAKCPAELNKLKPEINRWLEYSWNKGINTFITKATTIKKIKSNSIIFKDIPSQYREDEEVLLECIKKAIPGVYLPSKVKKAIENHLSISIKSKDEMGDAIAKIKEKPSILHDAYRNIYAEKIDKNWKAIIKFPEAYRKDKQLVLRALLSYAEKKNISIDDKYRDNINKTLILKLLEHSSDSCADKIRAIIPHRYYDDKDIMAMIISKNPFLLDEASVKIRNDKEVVLAAVSQWVGALQHASEELKNDKDFILSAVKMQGHALGYASKELQNDKEVVLSAVNQCGDALRYASEELRNDKEVVLAAVKKRGDALEYASEELKDDKEIVLAAVNQWLWGNTLQYASEKLKNDKEVVLAAVKHWGGALKYASEELQNDKEFILSAVDKCYGALEYASEDLKNDRDLVLAAVKMQGYALRYASEELQNDKEIVLSAVNEYGGVLQYASAGLKNDKDVVLAAVKNGGTALEYASKELKNDKEVVLSAVDKCSWALKYAAEELKDDKEVVLFAVKQWGEALEYVSEELKNDKEVVLAAVKARGDALQYASEELKDDKEVVLVAVDQWLWGNPLQYASEKIKNDKEVVLAAVKMRGDALRYASEKLKNDKEVVLAAVKQNGGALRYASKELKNDKEVARAAVNQCDGALKYASEELRKNYK